MAGNDANMPDLKDDPKSSEWRPYVFARDQWHCRICGESFLYSETVRKHIANEHDETMPPSMYEYFRGAVWQRKKLPSGRSRQLDQEQEPRSTRGRARG